MSPRSAFMEGTLLALATVMATPSRIKETSSRREYSESEASFLRSVPSRSQT
jgi:hypothetical protein